MARTGVLHSVVTRLIAAVVVGGLAVSVGWGALQWHRRESLGQVEAAQRVAATMRDLQGVLRRMLDHPDRTQIEQALNVFAATQPVRAVRLRMPGEAPITLGNWIESEAELDTVALPEAAQPFAAGVSAERATVFQMPFRRDNDPYLLEVMFDAPSLMAQARLSWYEQTRDDVLLVAALSLLVLLLVRRWFVSPLAEIAELVRVGARHEQFQGMALRHRGEFHDLSAGLAESLQRLESTGAELAVREQAYQDLYRLAPAAIVCTDPRGTIAEANQEAGTLLSGGDDRALVGRPIGDVLAVEDRTLFSQVLDRLRVEDVVRCGLRLRPIAGMAVVDASVQASAVRDASGELLAVRVALSDVTTQKQLQAQLLEKTRLLDLLVDHMSDAVLLADSRGNVVASNQQSARLLRKSTSSLHGQNVYDERFWDGFGLLEHERFQNRLMQARQEPSRTSHDRSETQTGVYLVNTVPVRDAADGFAGRLWVIQDVTQHEQNERLLSQQKQQLRALRCIGPALIDVRSVEQLIEKTADQMFTVVGVDGVGVSMRDGTRGRRARHLLHRGKGPYLLDANRKLLEKAASDLMPQVLGQSDALFWPDLETAGTGFSKAFAAAGFTSLAAAPVRSSIETQGILWIARRGGERIEPHQLHLLETLCPLLAARLEMAQLTERLQGLHLADPLTDLPSHLQFERAMYKMAGRPDQRCGLLVIDLDGFREHNDRLGRETCDAVLRAVGVRLLGACRKSGFLARFGGAAFGLLAPDLDADQAGKLGERLRDEVAREPYAVPGAEAVAVTASIGVASFPGDSVRVDELLELALVRVTAAKARGRGQVIAASEPVRRAG